MKSSSCNRLKFLVKTFMSPVSIESPVTTIVSGVLDLRLVNEVPSQQLGAGFLLSWLQVKLLAKTCPAVFLLGHLSICP